MCLLWGAGAAGGNGSRQGLLRYLTADEAAGYLAIADLFSATLFTDLSSVQVTTQLAERA
jgi:hypothetical protein